MYLVLLFAITALLGAGRSANVNKHMRLLSGLDNSIEHNVAPLKQQPGARRFLTITQRPLATYAHNSGDVLELTCDAVGAPAPSIHWFKNDAPVYEYDVESNELIDSNPSSLARVISTLLVTRTMGHDVYTCLVTAGSKTARATTVVYSADGSTSLSERAKLYPLEPRIVVTYEMYVDTIGNNIVLPCRVKGHPRPHVTWRDNKGVLIKKDSRMKVLNMNSRAQKLVAMARDEHLCNKNDDKEESEVEESSNSGDVTTLAQLKQDVNLKRHNTASCSLTYKDFERDLSYNDLNISNMEASIDTSQLIHLDDLDIVRNSLSSMFNDYDDKGNEIIAEIEVVASTSNTDNIVQDCIDMSATQLTENDNNQSSILNCIEQPQSNRENDHQLEINNIGRPKRGRKRKVEDQSRKERKRRANVNEKYISAKGKEVLPKEFDNTYHCDCKKKCTTILSIDSRKQVFDQFWSLGSFEGRCAFICGKVTQTHKAMTYTSSNSKRIYSRKYTLCDTEICKKTFLKTLGICQSRIDIAMQKNNRSSNFKDNRGTASGGKNKINEDDINLIVGHIDSFPKYISHYCRGKTDSRYLLNTELNLLKMYDLFKAKYPTNENLPSLATYKKIFYEKFNLRFKAPKSDTCKTCDTFAANIKSLTGTEAEEAKKQRDLHINKASELRKQMNADLNLASEKDTVETLTFDMQKTHPLPKISTNIAYYKRQLNLYNLGIYIGSSKRSIFNLWLENEGGKGTQEVGSCLRKYILNNIQSPVTDLILWADSCGGQNRSIKLVLMLIHTMQHHTSLQSITLRFLLSGHSFLPNDANFGVIESQLKTQQRLYTLEDYAESIQKSKKNKKFEVSRMVPSDMLSVRPLEQAITNRKVDSAKNKVNWLKLHEIVIEKPFPYILKVKTEIAQEDAQIVNLEKAGKGRKPVLKNINLPKCWPNGKSLSVEKLKDLKELMKLIPADAKPFYDFLKHTPGVSIDEDIDGYHVEDIEQLSEDGED